MILDTTLKLEAVLAGAVATNQPAVHVDYVDWNAAGEPTVPTPFRTQLNGNTDVTILAAPLTGYQKAREPIRVVIYNRDTANIDVTVKTDDGTTERIETRQTIATLNSLCWEKNVGWYTTASSAGIFTNLTVTGNLTVNGNTVLGDAAGDALTIAPNAVTWSNNPTHSGNHTFSGSVTVTTTAAVGGASSGTRTAFSWSGADGSSKTGHLYADAGGCGFGDFAGSSPDEMFYVDESGSTLRGYVGGAVIWTTSATGLSMGFPLNLKAYTVATLPAGADGMIAFVTDALAPTFLGALTGGSTTHVPVFYDGSAWKSF